MGADHVGVNDAESDSGAQPSSQLAADDLGYARLATDPEYFENAERVYRNRALKRRPPYQE